MNQDSNNQEEKYISLRDMFFYVLKKWKLLCAGWQCCLFHKHVEQFFRKSEKEDRRISQLTDGFRKRRSGKGEAV